MKRILCIILAFAVCWCESSFASAGTTYAAYPDSACEEFQALFTALTGETTVSETITRGEYVHLLVKTAKLNNYALSQPEDFFSDVPQEHPYYEDIICALEHDLIHYNEAFLPDNIITLNEAVKIAVCVLGRGFLAEEKGGYPSGYLAEAARIGVLDSITVNGESKLTDDVFYRLVGNILQSNLLTQIFFDNGDIEYRQSTETMLSSLYSVSAVEGIVSATAYNSYIQEDFSDENYTVEIDGEIYLTDEKVPADLLGLKCKAYYSDEKGTDEKVLVLIPLYNQELTFAMDKVDRIADKTLYYEDETAKIRRISLDESYMMVYNGRVCTRDTNRFFEDSGTIRLVDNNGDSKYDVAHITSIQYVAMESVNVEKKIVTDSNAPENHFDFQTTTFLSINSEYGDEIAFRELEENKVLGVMQSADGLVTTLTQYQSSVDGMITAIDSSEEEIYINDVKYKLSDYARMYYATSVKAGINAVFQLGFNGEIVTVKGAMSNWKYGYLLKAAESNGLKKGICVKIFDQDGNFSIYDVKKKVFVDGVSMKVADAYDSVMQAQESLIRFQVSEDGLISHFDFEELNTSGYAETDRDEKNLLIKYNDAEFSAAYKASTQTFGSNYSIANAIIFWVPEDKADEDSFEVCTAAQISVSNTYTVKGIYNVNEENACGAVVLESNPKKQMMFSSSYLVLSVRYTHNEDGEDGRSLYCWGKGTYTTLFLPETVSVHKESGADIGKGDIIRVKTLHNNIVNVYVDADFSPEGIKENSNNNGGYTLHAANGSVGYISGWAYQKSSYLALAAEREESKIADLTTTYLGTVPIICYNVKSGNAREITVDEVEHYIAYEENADFVVIRTNDYKAVSVFVYDFEWR